MELNQIYNMDCLEGLRLLPDKSIDLIVTDPPYNVGKAKWDKINNYIEWCGEWIKECERVLKDNGSLYFWHNDMKQIAQLMEHIRQNTRFIFNSFIIWDKGDFRAWAWKNPSENINLRSWFNTCEYCLYYTFQDEAFYGLQNYFKSEREKTGKTATELDRIMGIKASYCYWEKPTTHSYRIPDKKNYIALQSYFEGKAFRREYEDLRREYEDLRYTHNLDKNHNNVWKSAEKNDSKLHICKKPLDLTERIISTSSKKGATVLDPFMGSGTTAVACINTNRNYIGFELDTGYFDIANKRIGEHNKRR